MLVGASTPLGFGREGNRLRITAWSRRAHIRRLLVVCIVASLPGQSSPANLRSAKTAKLSERRTMYSNDLRRTFYTLLRVQPCGGFLLADERVVKYPMQLRFVYYQARSFVRSFIQFSEGIGVAEINGITERRLSP